jgi:hypothetical protein
MAECYPTLVYAKIFNLIFKDLLKRPQGNV